MTLALTFILLLPVDDPAAAEVIGRQFDSHPVSGQDLDVVHAHLPRDMRQDDLPRRDLHAEHRIGEGLQNAALHLDLILIERLRKMNEPAISLYLDHGIDIRKEPLEIAVCAQHNNGGLAGNIWWESLNIKHLFPIGEVNGSHGVYRPGGAALNSGQVAGFRVAEYISEKYAGRSLDQNLAKKAAMKKMEEVFAWIDKGVGSNNNWRNVRNEFQFRMSKAGALIRSVAALDDSAENAWRQWKDLKDNGCAFKNMKDLAEALRNLQLCFAHVVYLEAVGAAIKDGVGSRGSALVLDEKGTQAHQKLDSNWKFMPENPDFRNKVLETSVLPDGKVENNWVPRRELPSEDAWFEAAWAAYRNGDTYE